MYCSCPVVSIALITDEVFMGSSETRPRTLRLIRTRNIHGSGGEDRNQMSYPPTLEFFRIEFYRIYRICRILFLVVLELKITKNSLLKIL